MPEQARASMAVSPSEAIATAHDPGGGHGDINNRPASDPHSRRREIRTVTANAHRQSDTLKIKWVQISSPDDMIQ
jgi:hypothetical protein